MKRFLVLKLIPVIFLSGALLAGCSDEPSCPDLTEETRHIYPDEIGKVPYTGTDVLQFKNASGQIETYTGSGKDTIIETERTSGYADPACGQIHTVYHVGYSIQFLFQNKTIEFKHAPEDCSVKVDGKSFNVQLSAIGNKHLTFYKYYDSLLINDVYYSKVTAIDNFKQDTIFMNVAHGLLMLKSKDNIVLSIIK